MIIIDQDIIVIVAVLEKIQRYQNQYKDKEKGKERDKDKDRDKEKDKDRDKHKWKEMSVKVDLNRKLNKIILGEGIENITDNLFSLIFSFLIFQSRTLIMYF